MDLIESYQLESRATTKSLDYAQLSANLYRRDPSSPGRAGRDGKEAVTGRVVVFHDARLVLKGGVGALRD